MLLKALKGHGDGEAASSVSVCDLSMRFGDFNPELEAQPPLVALISKSFRFSFR